MSKRPPSVIQRVLRGALCLAFLPAAALAAPGEEDAAAPPTEITSKRLTFDYQKRYALFEDDVVVVDADMRMTADRMTVFFDAENNIRTITAIGNVRIEQDQNTALCGKADYDVANGKLVMTEEPSLQRGRDVLRGKVIIYLRDQDKIICSPGTLRIHPGDGEGFPKPFKK